VDLNGGVVVQFILRLVIGNQCKYDNSKNLRPCFPRIFCFGQLCVMLTFCVSHLIVRVGFYESTNKLVAVNMLVNIILCNKI